MDGNMSFNILQSLVTVLALVSSLTMVVIITIWTNLYARVFHMAGEIWSALLYEVRDPKKLNKIKKAEPAEQLRIMKNLFPDGIPNLLIDDWKHLARTRWVKYLWISITVVFCWLITFLIGTLIHMHQIQLGSEPNNSLIRLFVWASIGGLVGIAAIVVSFLALRHKTDEDFERIGMASQHLSQYREKKQ